MVLEAGKLKIKSLAADSLCGEDMLTVFSHGGGGKAALWDPFYKASNPIQEGSTFMN